MSARQIIVLAIAFVAAIGALLVIRTMGRDARPAVAAAADIPGERVLVAAKDIPQGAALTADDINWRVFPKESINANFVAETARPQARVDMIGWVARRPFLAGEPILAGAVLDPDGRGFMAAMVAPGYRAVSVEFRREAAAGLFIQPNDRVDVILTMKVDVRSPQGGTEEVTRTSTVLEDVRVLAMDDSVTTQVAGATPTRVEDSDSVVVLELTAADARLLAQAETIGDIRLALRGVEIEPPGVRVASNAARGAYALNENVAEGSVRVHAFGEVNDGRRR
ncbi:MAG: Flp pilus assembly protein CpaB [Alphaproteobacteria bacterium]|nr:Flp pilus assembly protein CpaB [Alphaproteobacteria bacterium]